MEGSGTTKGSSFVCLQPSSDIVHVVHSPSLPWWWWEDFTPSIMCNVERIVDRVLSPVYSWSACVWPAVSRSQKKFVVLQVPNLTFSWDGESAIATIQVGRKEGVRILHEHFYCKQRI